jgi:GAF domain-containing protein
MLARGHRIRVGEGMIGWSIARCQPRVALEAGEDAVRLATPELPETRSEAAVPLRSRGQVLGALTVQDSQPGVFDQDTIAVLQTMADQVAVALDNARLFTESQSALEASRRAYGELSRQAWADLIRTHPEWGYTYAHHSITPAEGAWCPEMLQAVRAGQSVQDHNRKEHMLAVPLKVRGQVVGVLRFEKGEADGVWTSEEIGLLETLVDQLGQALESARLYHDSQRRAARERLTREITDELRRATSAESIVQTAVDSLFRVLGTSRAFGQLEAAPPAQGTGADEP